MSSTIVIILIVLLLITFVDTISIDNDGTFVPLDVLRPAVTIDEQRDAIQQLLIRQLSPSIADQFEINIMPDDGQLHSGLVTINRSTENKLLINAYSAVDAAYGIQVRIMSIIVCILDYFSDIFVIVVMYCLHGMDINWKQYQQLFHCQMQLSTIHHLHGI
jgi:hypothetical protein